jgi:hypothetical protein
MIFINHKQFYFYCIYKIKNMFSYYGTKKKLAKYYPHPFFILKYFIIFAYILKLIHFYEIRYN